MSTEETVVFVTDPTQKCIPIIDELMIIILRVFTHSQQHQQTDPSFSY